METACHLPCGLIVTSIKGLTPLGSTRRLGCQGGRRRWPQDEAAAARVGARSTRRRMSAWRQGVPQGPPGMLLRPRPPARVVWQEKDRPRAEARFLGSAEN